MGGKGHDNDPDAVRLSREGRHEGGGQGGIRRGEGQGHDEGEKEGRGVSEHERRESGEDRSPESGPMGTDHEPAPVGPMGIEDKHEEEAESRVGEEDDD
ncbi:MAG: hypothetical protein M3R38_22765 [Actinomycetota bacterium]|nr:hypothetical protein [Actinomycetota bacterium]